MRNTIIMNNNIAIQVVRDIFGVFFIIGDLKKKTVYLSLLLAHRQINLKQYDIFPFFI